MAVPFHERKPIQIEEKEDKTYADYGEEVIRRLMDPASSVKVDRSQSYSDSESQKPAKKSMSNSTRVAKRACRDSIRVVIFLLLMFLLYNWNIRFFRLGDSQKVIGEEEKCTTINRFDFTSKSWHEELTLNNLGNVYHQKQICDNYKSEFSQLMKNGVLKAAHGIQRMFRDEED